MAEEPKKPESEEQKPDEELDEEELDGVKGGRSQKGLGELSKPISPTKKKLPFGGFDRDSVKD